ncbi:MAG: bifunctional oligoribonuclease/PAP phosphatase NrnA [Bacteroidetes bacterium]|nr:bifunctional oligoribonuclease/PAP phosphatase NrnA [Bacteroidota bacterium]
MNLHSLSENLYERIKACSGKILITIHQNPDGDAIGSGLGLQHLLMKEGKNVVLISPNSIADYLNWLPGIADVVNYELEPERISEHFANAELLMCLDFNDPKRAGGLENEIRKFKGDIAVIDHHQNPSHFAKYLYSDTSSPATAQLVYRLSQDWRIELNVNVAKCLYTGILTDTGSFKFSSVNKETHLVAAHLVSFGINHDEIHARIYDAFSENRLRLFGLCFYNRLEIIENGRVALMYVTQKDHHEFDIQKGDTEGLVNFNLSITGVEVGVLFIEEEKMIKISFRSKGDIPVNEFAKENFDGGGHINAAGGRSYKPLTSTIEHFKKCIKPFIQQY